MKRCSSCKVACALDATRCEACGSHDLLLESVTVDGRYVVDAQLGMGAMGVVLKAHDAGLDREVALKMIAPRWAADAGAVARFRREAATLAAIRNEHVVQVYSFGPHQGSYFFAMEYVRGPTLEALIGEHADHGARVPVHRALTILLQIAEGLEAVHAAGVVHRDVKPSNVVIEERTGRPVVVDFGLAYRKSDELEVAGTPAYMAPEQTGLVRDAEVTPATDVYGLACTAFDLLTNRPPFLGEIASVLTQHAHLDPPRLSSFRSELAPLDRIFARALAKRPELRFRSAGELRDALDAAAAPWLAVKTAGEVRDDSTTTPTGPRVLVVDDDDAFRRFAARAAQLAFYGGGVEVRTAPSGTAALQSARRYIPELLILDFDMPGLDGIATLSALRALPGGTRARVLVVSAKAGDDERWRFGVLGVGSFVEKPVELPVLVAAIGEAMKPLHGSPAAVTLSV